MNCLWIQSPRQIGTSDRPGMISTPSQILVPSREERLASCAPASVVYRSGRGRGRAGEAVFGTQTPWTEGSFVTLRIRSVMRAPSALGFHLFQAYGSQQRGTRRYFRAYRCLGVIDRWWLANGQVKFGLGRFGRATEIADCIVEDTIVPLAVLDDFRSMIVAEAIG